MSKAYDICCTPFIINAEQLKSCELRAIARTLGLIAGIVAAVLSGILASGLPSYAMGLLAGGGGLVVILSFVDCMRLKKTEIQQSGGPEAEKNILSERWKKWALGTNTYFNPYAEKIKKHVHLKTAEGEMLLHLAAESGKLEMCKELILLGANVTATGKNGMTVLHYVCSYETDVDAKKRVDLINYFFDVHGEKIHVNAQMKSGETALDLAEKLCAEDTQFTPLCSLLKGKSALKKADLSWF